MEVFCKFSYVSPSLGGTISIRSDAGSSSPSSVSDAELTSGIKCSVNDISTEMIFESASTLDQIIVQIDKEEGSCYYDGTTTNAGLVVEIPELNYSDWGLHPDVVESN